MASTLRMALTSILTAVAAFSYFATQSTTVIAPTEMVEETTEISAPKSPKKSSQVGFHPLVDTFNKLVKNTADFSGLTLTNSEVLFEKKSYKESYNSLITNIENLISSEEWRLGYLYFHGYGVEKNYKLAYQWFKKSADAGNARAMGLLGYQYESGSGVEMNIIKAKNYYEKASELGGPISMNNLGYLYQEGKGVDKSLETAISWFEKSRNSGCAMAENNLGWLCLQGKLSNNGSENCISLFEAAAEKGELNAIYNLRNMYSNGNKVQVDKMLAAKWGSKADSLKREITSYVSI